MKLSFPCLLVLAIALFFTIDTSNAQSSKTTIATLQAPPSKIAIDGDLKEWGDSLRYYNTEKKINFSIANTKDTLYVAIRINDRTEQTRILKAGITFSIDPKGKKKETFSVTFPLNIQGGTPFVNPQQEDNGQITQQDRDELMRERITNLRGIRVTGFKDIEGDMITTSNTYGFQTAVNYDQDGYLVCEAAIPMRFFHVDDVTKSEWAFNFKINGLQQKPKNEGDDHEGSEGRGGRGGGMGGGGGRGGHGGRGGGGNRAGTAGESGQGALFKSEDFWEKFYLAK